ncbi:hypothetical protein BDV18DRAFT_130844 [Aspergillus unguis]
MYNNPKRFPAIPLRFRLLNVRFDDRRRSLGSFFLYFFLICLCLILCALSMSSHSMISHCSLGFRS